MEARNDEILRLLTCEIVASGEMPSLALGVEWPIILDCLELQWSHALCSGFAADATASVPHGVKR